MAEARVPDGRWKAFVAICESGERAVWVLPADAHCAPVELRYIEDSADGVPSGLLAQLRALGALPLSEVLDLIPLAVEAITHAVQDCRRSVFAEAVDSCEECDGSSPDREAPVLADCCILLAALRKLTGGDNG